MTDLKAKMEELSGKIADLAMKDDFTDEDAKKLGVLQKVLRSLTQVYSATKPKRGINEPDDPTEGTFDTFKQKIHGAEGHG